MSRALSIEADWERSESKVPEERACFAAIGILHLDQWLSVAEDAFVNRIRLKVHLSAYKLAEWLAWNWWRLRWEPRRRSVDWAMAHRMTTIGGGYVWPNLTIVSDGERVLLNAQPTTPSKVEPLHYLSTIPAVVRADELESAIDTFIEQVLGQLQEEKIEDSNLNLVWADVLAERKDPEATRVRRLEALLGFDPEDADTKTIQRLIRDSKDFGEQSVNELAADDPRLSSAQLRDLAHKIGSEANPQGAVRLSASALSKMRPGSPAWVKGAETASALRKQEHLHDIPIDNEKLCGLVGVDKSVISNTGNSPLSFALDETKSSSRVALRSKRETGRRFDLARLLGDRLVSPTNGRLYPATRAYTYRQKLQRSFAAEFLCPFSAVSNLLKGDFSEESIDDAAAYFNVSERAVRTILVNHKVLDRQELDEDAQISIA